MTGRKSFTARSRSSVARLHLWRGALARGADDRHGGVNAGDCRQTASSLAAAGRDAVGGVVGGLLSFPHGMLREGRRECPPAPVPYAAAVMTAVLYCTCARAVVLCSNPFRSEI